jgi:transposase
MISMEAWTTIRYLRAQGKGIKRIARELGVSRNTVRLALQREGPPHYERPPQRKSKLEPYREFIQELRGQGLIGSRILKELKKRGYEGSQPSFYCYLRALKKEAPDPRVCLRYETAPGQQSQFDWSPYTVDLGGVLSRVVVFCLVLSYSRRKHYWASLDETQGSIYEAIEEGFWHFSGATRQLLIDNAKAFVLNAAPTQRQWNPHFLELCGYYGVQPIPCQVRKPRGKGKVERPFFHLEEQFIKGNHWRDLLHFCQELARFEREELDQVVHHTTQEKPIDRFQQEQPRLLPLPASRFVGIQEEVRKVNWDCLLSFRGNKYSVPHIYAGKLVWVRTSQGATLQVYNQKRECVATHSLSPGKGVIIMEKAHYAGIRQQSPHTRTLLKQAFLERFPSHWLFLEKLFAQQRLNPESHIRGILHLANLYSPAAMEEAFAQAHEYNTFSQHFIRGLVEGKPPTPASSSPSTLTLRTVPAITVKGDLRVYQGILELPNCRDESDEETEAD